MITDQIIEFTSFTSIYSLFIVIKPTVLCNFRWNKPFCWRAFDRACIKFTTEFTSKKNNLALEFGQAQNSVLIAAIVHANLANHFVLRNEVLLSFFR